VFVPASAAGAKRRQIEAYGAELVAVDGPRSAATAAALAEADSGAVYASHVYNPLGLAGNATCAYEIVAQLGRAPEAVLLPVGHGTLLLGLHLGFKALRDAGLIAQIPGLHAVQALACAPLWAVSQYGRAGLDWTGEGATLAEGIRVLHPLRGDFVLNAIGETGGSVLVVDDPEIHAGHGALARLGLYVEPTCAAVWPVLDQVSGDLVVILTGSGLKTPLDLAPPAPRELPQDPGPTRKFGL
jgi:threonine synthase